MTPLHAGAGDEEGRGVGVSTFHELACPFGTALRPPATHCSIPSSCEGEEGNSEGRRLSL